MSKKYDYSKIHYDGDIKELMTNIADNLEEYLIYVKTYAIFDGMSEEEWNENMKTAEKLIKKLRKGDPSVFNINELNNALDSEHDIILGSDYS